MSGPPAYVPPSKRLVRCARHRKYAGANAPKCDCPVCWGMYLKAKYGMGIEAVLAPAQVRVTDRTEAEAFVTSLKRAIDSSVRSGGLYSAFLHTGETGLHVEVAICKAK